MSACQAASWWQPSTRAECVNNITGSPYRIGERSATHFYQDGSGFGEPISNTGTLDEPLAFHQMFRSKAEGILVAGVRAYDVTTGRFLSPDPLGLGASPDTVRAADAFGYAQDNPIAMQDATGYAPCLQTLEGGCQSNLGEQSYEEQRSIAHENARKLKAEEDEWAVRNSPWAASATDGQQAEQSNSTKVRSPTRMEAPTEPVRKDARSAERNGHGRKAGGGSIRDVASEGDVLEVVVYGSRKEERAAERLARKERKSGNADASAAGAPLLADAYRRRSAGLAPDLMHQVARRCLRVAVMSQPPCSI